jgi:hypothetical protein
LYIGQNFYGTKGRGVVQAADFLIKEAERCSRGYITREMNEYTDSLSLIEAEALFLMTEKKKGRRAEPYEIEQWMCSSI